MSHYDTLSVSQTAPIEVIRGAYKALSQVHHPDKGGDPEKMTAINEAWRILSDPDARAAHDMVLSFHEAMAGAKDPIRKPPPKAVTPRRGDPFEVDADLLKQMKSPSPSMSRAKGDRQYGWLASVIFRA